MIHATYQTKDASVMVDALPIVGEIITVDNLGVCRVVEIYCGKPEDMIILEDSKGVCRYRLARKAPWKE